MTADDEKWRGKLAFELVPAAIFNFAVAFAVATWMRQSGLGEFAAAGSVIAGIGAFLVAWAALRRIGGAAERFPLPHFDSTPAGPEPIEHMAADCRRSFEQSGAPPEQQSGANELLLDDILESIGPDSRVVRLFDPKALPTAGELQARIDHHLRTALPAPTPPDATEELHEAIRELRRSLR